LDGLLDHRDTTKEKTTTNQIVSFFSLHALFTSEAGWLVRCALSGPL
jgi:hypothetical protein